MLPLHLLNKIIHSHNHIITKTQYKHDYNDKKSFPIPPIFIPKQGPVGLSGNPLNWTQFHLSGRRGFVSSNETNKLKQKTFKR